MALVTTSTVKPKPSIFSPICLARKTHKNNVNSVDFRYQPNSTHTKNVVSQRLHKNNKRGFLTVVCSSSNGAQLEPNPEVSTGYGRILLSDVVVKRKRNVIFGRKWNAVDIGSAGVVIGMHLLSLFAPFYFNWSAFWVAFGLYVVTGLLGITLSFHRNLSHRSFKLPKWLEYLFAYCGVLALQVITLPRI